MFMFLPFEKLFPLLADSQSPKTMIDEGERLLLTALTQLESASQVQPQTPGTRDKSYLTARSGLIPD